MTTQNLATCEAIAMKYAYMVCPSDITYAAKQIADEVNEDWPRLRDALLHALDNHRCADVPMTAYGPVDPSTADMFGETMIGDDRVYWWHNNAESHWSTTRPDWWPTP